MQSWIERFWRFFALVYVVFGLILLKLCNVIVVGGQLNILPRWTLKVYPLHGSAQVRWLGLNSTYTLCVGVTLQTTSDSDAPMIGLGHGLNNLGAMPVAYSIPRSGIISWIETDNTRTRGRFDVETGNWNISFRTLQTFTAGSVTITIESEIASRQTGSTGPVVVGFGTFQLPQSQRFILPISSLLRHDDTGSIKVQFGSVESLTRRPINVRIEHSLVDVDSAAVVNPASWTVIITPNDFIDVITVKIDPPSDTCEPLNGQTSPASELYTVIPLSGSFVMHSSGGVFYGSMRLLEHCVDDIFYSKSRIENALATEGAIYAVSSNPMRLYVWNPRDKQSSMQEIVDSTGHTLEAYMKTVMSGDESEMRITSVAQEFLFGHTLVLIVGPDAHCLIAFDPHNRSWSTRFMFPSFIRKLVNYRIVNSSSSSVEDSITTDLISCELGRGVTTSLWVYGNALLHSNDVGFTFSTSFVCPNSTRCISHVSSTAFRGVAIKLTNGSTFYTSASLRSTPMLLPKLHSPARPAMDYIFFSLSEKLFQLVFNDSGMIELFIDQEEMIQKLAQGYALDRMLYCPYDELSVSESSAEGSAVFKYSIGGYPHIYIDKGRSYTFDLVLRPRTTLQALNVGKHHLSKDIIDLNVARDNLFAHAVGNELVVFTITIRDHIDEKRSQTKSGLSMIPAPIELVVPNMTVACDVPRRFFMTVFSGCPPGISLMFNSSASRPTGDFCDEYFDMPCIYFEYEFVPRFYLYDAISDTSTSYDGNFTLSIIGSGKRSNTIKKFTDDEIAAYNQGSSPIWTALDAVSREGVKPSIFGPQSKLSWLCGPGSPCARVLPSSFPESPDLFLLVRASSKGAGMDSYCDHAVDFVIRLHGLQMDHKSMVMLAGGTMSIIFLVMIIGFIYFLPRRFVVYRKESSPTKHETQTIETTIY